jgi:hypothetical protein
MSEGIQRTYRFVVSKRSAGEMQMDPSPMRYVAECIDHEVIIVEGNDLDFLITEIRKAIESQYVGPVTIYPNIGIELQALETFEEPKTLAQISYEHSGGPENFGEWDNAPNVVKAAHERMSRAVIDAAIGMGLVRRKDAQ